MWGRESLNLMMVFVWKVDSCQAVICCFDVDGFKVSLIFQGNNLFYSLQEEINKNTNKANNNVKTFYHYARQLLKEFFFLIILLCGSLSLKPEGTGWNSQKKEMQGSATMDQALLRVQAWQRLTISDRHVTQLHTYTMVWKYIKIDKRDKNTSFDEPED